MAGTGETAMQTARMPECSLTELERTAETYSDPIKTLEYSKTPKAARAKTPLPWSLLPYVIGIALFIGGYHVLNWLPWKFSPDIETKVHRYLLGAICILAVLGIERALEIFVINRARSWPLFPYVWDQICFEITYESDLKFIALTMESIVAAELGEAMEKNVAAYREVLASTPVDHVKVKERPVVVFRPNPNTWVEAIVRYLVDPKDASSLKSSIVTKLLAALNAAPDKVLLPKSNMR